MEQGAHSRGGRKPLGGVAIAALAILSVAVVAIVVFLVIEGGTKLEPGVPEELSADELKDVAEDDGPVYWAGAVEGTKLEVTETSKGHVFVRYLPELAPIGDNKPQYTTVATYEQANALQAVRRAGEQRGMVSKKVPGGGLAIWSKERPTSVYVGLPNSNRLVEVYSPNPKGAGALAVSGRIQPVS